MEALLVEASASFRGVATVLGSNLSFGRADLSPADNESIQKMVRVHCVCVCAHTNVHVCMKRAYQLHVHVKRYIVLNRRQ